MSQLFKPIEYFTPILKEHIAANIDDEIHVDISQIYESEIASKTLTGQSPTGKTWESCTYLELYDFFKTSPAIAQLIPRLLEEGEYYYEDDTTPLSLFERYYEKANENICDFEFIATLVSKCVAHHLEKSLFTFDPTLSEELEIVKKECLQILSLFNDDCIEFLDEVFDDIREKTLERLNDIKESSKERDSLFKECYDALNKEYNPMTTNEFIQTLQSLDSCERPKIRDIKDKIIYYCQTHNNTEELFESICALKI